MLRPGVSVSEGTGGPGSVRRSTDHRARRKHGLRNSRRLRGVGAATLAASLALVGLGTSSAHAGAIGDVAGCGDHTLGANDDASSAEVTLPFAIWFAGTLRTSLYVNNNGNVSFGSPIHGEVMTDIVGATGIPMIAPFFSDVDTSGFGSGVVTYGASADGRTFCVSWPGVGYYMKHVDRTNAFQLVIEDRAYLPGGRPGDVDIVFNYDRVLWETGDASGGQDGLDGGWGGPTGGAARVGLSYGTGLPGDSILLSGSGQARALLDDGPLSLVGHGQNPDGVLGRYVWHIQAGVLTPSDGTPGPLTSPSPSPGGANGGAAGTGPSPAPSGGVVSDPSGDSSRDDPQSVTRPARPSDVTAVWRGNRIRVGWSPPIGSIVTGFLVQASRRDRRHWRVGTIVGQDRTWVAWRVRSGATRTWVRVAALNGSVRGPFLSVLVRHPGRAAGP